MMKMKRRISSEMILLIVRSRTLGLAPVWRVVVLGPVFGAGDQGVSMVIEMLMVLLDDGFRLVSVLVV
jgi:hypothetical protein